jgi:hypothetical protein
VLCPPIFIFSSTSFSLSGIVASYFYPLFFSLRSLSFSTYTFNISLYIFSVFDKLVFEIHVGRCCTTIDLFPSLFKFSAVLPTIIKHMCKPLQTQHLTLDIPLPFMQRNVSIKLTKASVILRTCCSAVLVNIRGNNCLLCVLRCLEQCVGEFELHRLYLKCLDQFQVEFFKSKQRKCSYTHTSGSERSLSLTEK